MSESESKIRCPECKSVRVIKNGTIMSVKKRKKTRVQTYRCLNCERRFREPRKKV